MMASLTRVFIFPGLHVISLVWHVFLLLCFNMFYCLIPGLHVISLVWLCVNAQTPTVRKWMGITGCRSYLYFQPIFWTAISVLCTKVKTSSQHMQTQNQRINQMRITDLICPPLSPPPNPHLSCFCI